VLGFDPMVQVIHEDDLTAAFAAAIGDGIRGVYNVTGSGELPLSVIVEEAGSRALPLPGPLFSLLRGRFGLSGAASGAVDFLKHPCLVDGARFQKDAGFAPSRSLRETVRSMRAQRKESA
jgi:UDP-glucose 4-epimerase